MMPHNLQQPRRSIDGILLPAQERVPKARPSNRMPEPTSRTHFSYSGSSAQPRSKTARVPFWKKILRAISQTLLFLLLLMLGILIQSAVVGQLAIFLYALASFILKISSRTTFFLVLGCFMIVLFASVRSDVTLAATFAMYAFLLLIVGTISLAREVRSEI